MPSNADIIDLIDGVSDNAGFERPDTSDLTNTQLAELLSVTRKRAKNGADDSADDSNVDDVNFSHVISDGKALTTKRGILSEGATVTASDLPGGSKTLKKLIKSGYITEA